jgi:hypothetical protein
MYGVALASVGAGVFCSACSSAHSIPSRAATARPITASPLATASVPTWIQPDCATTRFAPSHIGLPEAAGIVPAPNQFWALVFGSVPVPRGQDVKIVYRMTGGGTLRLVADGPSHMQVAPDWQEMHVGSNWTTHPGDEWGAGFTFGRAGCWEVVAVRGTLVGRVGIPVQ